jgi:hypothetical protein
MRHCSAGALIIKRRVLQRMASDHYHKSNICSTNRPHHHIVGAAMTAKHSKTFCAEDARCKMNAGILSKGVRRTSRQGNRTGVSCNASYDSLRLARRSLGPGTWPVIARSSAATVSGHSSVHEQRFGLSPAVNFCRGPVAAGQHSGRRACGTYSASPASYWRYWWCRW